jgi:hypothetical protein
MSPWVTIAVRRAAACMGETPLGESGSVDWDGSQLSCPSGENRRPVSRPKSDDAAASSFMKHVYND